MQHKKQLIIQRIFGTLYILAGISKFFPEIESVEDVLEKAAMVNKDTLLEKPTLWMSEHHTFMAYFIGCAMITAGLVLLLNRFAVKPALYGTVLMMICFMTFLHSSQPEVFALDLPFILASVYLLVKRKS